MLQTRRLGVLIVDDNDDTRELFADFLGHEGYHAIMARDGREALERLNYVEADVIVSDLDMPEVDGVELVRRLRASPRLASIPVIILTGLEKETAAARLGETAEHVRLVLRKPVKLGTLVSALTQVLAETPSE